VTERTVRLLQERLFDPPREVEVEEQGGWSPGLQRSWQLWDDDRGWVAEVEHTLPRYWGVLTRIAVVPAGRVRLLDAVTGSSADSPAGTPRPQGAGHPPSGRPRGLAGSTRMNVVSASRA
jgi:hypothetical protein